MGTGTGVLGHFRKKGCFSSILHSDLMSAGRCVNRLLAIGILSIGLGSSAVAGGTVRIAMTASDIPLPNGQTDQGAEGMRFMGYQVFEALVGYDLSSADKPVTLVPGLASSWVVDADNPTVWTYTLRDGVCFYDGSTFNADAVVCNLDKFLNPEAAHYDEKQAAQGRGRIPTVASYKELDANTVQITTQGPDALDSLVAADLNIVSNVYPHAWPWHFSLLEGSPWTDIRIRKAANLAIDREGMMALLGGMMLPAKGMVPPGSDWFCSPGFEVKTDVAAATQLMAEAGYSRVNP